MWYQSLDHVIQFCSMVYSSDVMSLRAHGEKRATEYFDVDGNTIKVVNLYIKTDDKNEVKVSDFLRDMSAIAQESRELGREFPVICNICCSRAMRKGNCLLFSK